MHMHPIGKQVVLEVDKISKYYHQVMFTSKKKRESCRKVLDSISFKVHEGEIIGLIGPNGEGKTTLLKIISGQLKPSAGAVRIFGSDGINDLKRNTTIITGNGWLGLSVFATVEENLYFFAKACGLSRVEAKRKVKEALNDLDLIDYQKEFPRNLSSGLRQRVLLARALILTTPILILDEPTSNCDFVVRSIFYNLLLEKVRNTRQSIILSSHGLLEIDEICNRFLFLKNGKRHQRVDKDGENNLTHNKFFIRVKSVDDAFLKSIDHYQGVSEYLRIDRDSFVLSSPLSPSKFLENVPFLSNIITFKIVKKSLYELYKEIYSN